MSSFRPSENAAGYSLADLALVEALPDEVLAAIDRVRPVDDEEDGGYEEPMIPKPSVNVPTIRAKIAEAREVLENLTDQPLNEIESRVLDIEEKLQSADTMLEELEGEIDGA